MKVAVASTDGAAVSPHFGRSRCFIVFEAVDGRIVGREVRDNTYTAHARGECHGEGDHHHDQPHSHAEIIGALRDCQAVLCGGMGWRAAEELKANGIRPLVVDAARPAEEVVKDFLAGTLPARGSFCRCEH